MNKLLLKLMSRAYRAPENEDGSGNGGGEAVGTGNDDRLALMAAIGDKSEAERSVEFRDVNDDDTTSDFSGVKTVDDPEAQAEADDAAAEQARLAAEQSAHQQTQPQRIVRKVNGQDMEITDELLARASKIAAADTFLAEAKRTRDDLAQRQAQALQQQTQNSADDDLAQIARAIQMGSEEEAVAALRKLTPRNPSQDDISRRIDDRLTFNQAISKFANDYQDIVGDPVLKGLAQNMDNRMIQQGDARPYYDRYSDIGNTLRTWVNSKAPAQQFQASKQDRKAAAPAAVPAASAKHASSFEAEPEESVQDTIAKIAAGRANQHWSTGTR